MKTHAFRLESGSDLKLKLLRFARDRHLEAAIILTTVGSLSTAVLRMAGAKEVKTWQEDLEIISLVGTLSHEDGHLHLCVSDVEGKVYGGHLKDGCTIRTTAEIVIGELENYRFKRKPDKSTGYDELIVEEKN